MIEIKENCFIYVPIKEKDVLAKLKRIKPESAVYYGKKGQVLGKHWFLNPITVSKLKLMSK